MKTVMLTPNSSIKSSTTVDANASEKRDSFYFPGCKKDANCNCEKCIESINATLDLMPQSIHRSSLTKLSVSRPAIRRSPVHFPSSVDPSTPKPIPRIRPMSLSPISSSDQSSSSQEEVKRRKRDLGFGVFVLRFILGLILLCGADNGVSWMVPRVLKPRLCTDLVMDLGENSKDIGGLNRKFMFLKNKLEGFLGENVSCCGSIDSVWKINQSMNRRPELDIFRDGLLLKSRCILYKSMSEEVSIWGWPLQTSGLLTADHSSRSFSILSGRVTEWSNGEPGYFVRMANSSWTQGKWNSSVVHLDPNTWILEYNHGYFLENSKLIFTALDFLKLRITRMFEKLKQEFWLPPAFRSQYSDLTRPGIPTPT
ncbi:hypothetical protein OROGR_014316 [Orobanche gracilis]